jgi:hypothetical protein
MCNFRTLLPIYRTAFYLTYFNINKIVIRMSYLTPYLAHKHNFLKFLLFYFNKSFITKNRSNQKPIVNTVAIFSWFWEKVTKISSKCSLKVDLFSKNIHLYDKIKEQYRKKSIKQCSQECLKTFCLHVQNWGKSPKKVSTLSKFVN